MKSFESMNLCNNLGNNFKSICKLLFVLIEFILFSLKVNSWNFDILNWFDWDLIHDYGVRLFIYIHGWIGLDWIGRLFVAYEEEFEREYLQWNWKWLKFG